MLVLAERREPDQAVTTAETMTSSPRAQTPHPANEQCPTQSAFLLKTMNGGKGKSLRFDVTMGGCPDSGSAGNDPATMAVNHGICDGPRAR
ncbi:hypothetical protein [Streptosporangium sp. NPDC051022]|uniref:hypothetical protein n=1 Tax=Streptosporangium sp. NPDC051022 TaxID=3155752 RepID=UPI00343BCE07